MIDEILRSARSGGDSVATAPSGDFERPSGLRAWLRTPWIAAVTAAILVAATILLFNLGDAFTLQVLAVALLNAAITVSLSLSFGFAGIFNLSQGSFYGLGAYTAAILITDHGLPFGVALLGSVAVATVFGALMGGVAVRLRGDYFAFASIAFTIIIVQGLVNLPEITRGGTGFFGIPTVSIFGWEINSSRDSFLLAAIGFVVVFTITHRISRSFFGRAMLAVNHDEMSARAMGISVAYTRVVAMALSSGLAGLTGCLLTVTMLYIQPADFSTLLSMNVTLWSIIGGPTSLIGSAVAAGGITYLQENLRSIVDYRLAILGIVVLVAVYLRGGVIRVPAWLRGKKGARRGNRH